MEVNGYHQLFGHQHSSKYLLLCSTEETHTVSKGLFIQNASLQLKCETQCSGMVKKKEKRSAERLRHAAAKQNSCQLATVNKSLPLLPRLWGLLIGPLFWDGLWWVALHVKVEILLTWHYILKTRCSCARPGKRCKTQAQWPTSPSSMFM